MELPYSGLHQLCAPMLDHLDRLPIPQRNALATVFGKETGPAPDRFLVGLAALTLLSEIAEPRPLLCLVDDAQWLDEASVQMLEFVGRRLLAERIALVCAARIGAGDDLFAGLPELLIGGLVESDARALLLENVRRPIDTAVYSQIIAESHGNPLALLELPRTWNAEDLAGGFGIPTRQPVFTKVEQSYAKRLLTLPAETQLFVLAAAAEPLGDPVLLHQAIETLGLEMTAAGPAVDAGLLQVGPRVEFAHPLVRTAAYRSAAADERQRVHRALAQATDLERDPDRRAWHRARATSMPDEEVAAELERSAGRAQARGGVAAAAAFLQRAVALSVDSGLRAERALAAAELTFQAGAFETALGLLATAEAGPLDEFQRARSDLVRGEVAFASGLGSDAPPILLRAAKRLERFDQELARETYLTAWGAALFAGPAGGGFLPEICRAALTVPAPSGSPRPLDLLLDGVSLLATEGRAAAAAPLQHAVKALIGMPVEDVIRWGWAATGASDAVWDCEGTRAIAARQVELTRAAGALAELPIHLAALGLAKAWTGDFVAAEALIAESDSVALATGTPIAPYLLLRLRALQGDEAAASAAIASALEQAAETGQGMAATWAHWAASVLYNGLARYEAAEHAAREAASNTFEPWASMWALPELVEAAARNGAVERARDAFAQLVETTQPCGTDFALGIESRCRALVGDRDQADELYGEAINRLGRTQLRPELARAHLLYGEWLRREGRRVDAREHLHTAHDMLADIGMEAFARRSRGELLATGETVRKRTDGARRDLTPQEAQIAELAREGYSNPEIGAQLFLSPRTVEWHMRKVFAKLGISSRKELDTVLRTKRLELQSV
jgi:DNA-binding CsgD family transcriptional regulator